jgi:LPXTG-site transpeptidase (sortase) family protein
MPTLARAFPPLRAPDRHYGRSRAATALLTLAILLAPLLAAPFAVGAQEDEEDGAGTASPIVSTRTGEVPSFGGRRPGPLDEPAPEERPAGVAPVAIEIERAAVSAEVEALDIVDGAMADPTGPWVVAWYEDLAGLGEVGNVVMAGHIDYWNVGPAVFYTIGQLAEGDEIGVTGTDGEVYAYAVEWVRQYDAADAPLEEITGRTGDETLTLITCGGTFDYATGEYLQRTVVRASRLPSGEA